MDEESEEEGDLEEEGNREGGIEDLATKVSNMSIAKSGLKVFFPHLSYEWFNEKVQMLLP